MKIQERRPALFGWVAGLLATLGAAGAASAQSLPPLSPSYPGAGYGTSVDLSGLVDNLGERVRHLAEDVEIEMGSTTEGRHLIQDTGEMADAVAQLEGTLDGSGRYGPDPARLREDYAAVDTTWHHLRSIFDRVALTPGVARAATRVGEADAALHNALSLSVPTGGCPQAAPTTTVPIGGPTNPAGGVYGNPTGYDGVPYDDGHDHDHSYGAYPTAPTGYVPTGVQYGDPQYGDPYDSGLPSPLPGGYGGSGLGALPPTVYESERVVVSPAPGYGAGYGGAVLGGGGGYIVGGVSGLEAAQVVASCDTFLAGFLPNSFIVPEREGFIRDVQRVRSIAAGASAEARNGAPPRRLLERARDLDRAWRQLDRRLGRVARGRPPGPNIAGILTIGASVRQFQSSVGAHGRGH